MPLGNPDSQGNYGVKVSAPTTIYSKQETVGTTAAALTAQALDSGGVVLKADDDNTGNIFIGTTGVTTTSGYRLKAGQSVPVSCADASDIFAIASAAGQKLHVLGS